MLPPNNRLRQKKDIDIVFKKGKGFKEGFLFLKTVKNNLNKPRFAFVVSQKISKKANLRNKIKRRLREVVRKKLKDFKKGTDNLIITAPGAETKDFWEIEETTNKLFKKAKVLNDEKSYPEIN